MQPEMLIVRKWIDRARMDLRDAETLMQADRSGTVGICFHCQQAAEKALKGFLCCRDVAFQWSHDIEYLLKLSLQQDQSFERFLDSASILSDYAVEFRYPTDEPDPTIQEARQALTIAREVFDFILERLPAEARP